MHREGVRLNPIDLRPTLATEARAILLRALSFDPAARYQSAAEFGDRLAHALTGSPRTAVVPPAHQVDRETIQSQSGGVAASSIPPTPGIVTGQPIWKRRGFVLGSVAIILIGIAVGVFIYRHRGRDAIVQNQNRKAEVEPTPSPSRSFNYWLDVQKMRNGKPYKQAFLSSGKEIFETGYKFRLNVVSPDLGYLYLFNEGPPSPSGTSFTMLYPTPLTNKGLATLGPDQLVQTGWNKFAGPTGTENFWMVWSASPVRELEAAKEQAFEDPHGALTGETLVTTRQFLTTKEKETKTRYATDKDTHQTTVRGAGDLLVRLVEFEHR